MERTKEEIEQKIEWDHYAILQTARREGIREGRLEAKLEGILEAKLEVAGKCKKLGMSLEIIKAATNLSDQQIKQL